MRNIYASASRVNISLYPNFDSEAQTALNALERFSQGLLYDWSSRQPTLSRQSGGITKHIDFGPDWRCIEGLLNRPWFERLWIWQEVFSAKSASIIRRGTFTPWESFCIATAGLNSLKWRGEEYLESASRLRDRVTRIFRLVETTRFKEESTLTDLLYRTDYCFYSDDKDRIFALSGMVPMNLSTKFLPDYSKTTSEVYQTTFVLAVEHERDLNLLRMCDTSLASSPSSPTWVPNFSHRSTTVRLPASHASGDSTPEIKLNPDRTLAVVGRSVAEITCIISAQEMRQERILEIIALSLNGEYGAESWKSDYVGDGSIIDAFCRISNFNRFAERYHIDRRLPTFEQVKSIMEQNMMRQKARLIDTRSKNYSRSDTLMRPGKLPELFEPKPRRSGLSEKTLAHRTKSPPFPTGASTSLDQFRTSSH